MSTTPTTPNAPTMFSYSKMEKSGDHNGYILTGPFTAEESGIGVSLIGHPPPGGDEGSSATPDAGGAPKKVELTVYHAAGSDETFDFTKDGDHMMLLPGGHLMINLQDPPKPTASPNHRK